MGGGASRPCQADYSPSPTPPTCRPPLPPPHTPPTPPTHTTTRVRVSAHPPHTPSVCPPPWPPLPAPPSPAVKYLVFFEGNLQQVQHAGPLAEHNHLLRACGTRRAAAARARARGEGGQLAQGTWVGGWGWVQGAWVRGGWGGGPGGEEWAGVVRDRKSVV